MDAHWVDAFTAGPLTGNQTVVVLAETEPEEERMQSLAREFGVAATTFVTGASDERGIRWFSPTTELAMCGHGTLGAAHVLIDDAGGAVQFAHRRGTMTAVRDDGWIVLEFPIDAALEVRPIPAWVSAVIGGEVRAVGRSSRHYLVELASSGDVAAAKPDLTAIAGLDADGVILTAAGGDGYDCTSRYFAPRLGIPEDHATGSAHCVVGPWWSQRLGRSKLLCRQASPRGGLLRVDVDAASVRLAGSARTVMAGTILEPDHPGASPG